ncbi:hypothetical protein Tco_1465446 [Tanacetum coccineum]
MIWVAASKAFSIAFTVLVIAASLKRLFVVPRLSHQSTSSLKELLEVSNRHGVMAAPIISILFKESVGSHAPRVILFGAIPAIIPVIPEVHIVPADPLVTPDVGTILVVSPTGVLDLVDYSSSSDSDPSEDSLPPVPDLPLVSPFLCFDNSKADCESEPAEQRSKRHESLTPLA